MTAANFAQSLGGIELGYNEETLVKVLAEAKRREHPVVEATSEQDSRRLFMFQPKDLKRAEEFIEKAAPYLAVDGSPNCTTVILGRGKVTFPPGEKWELQILEDEAALAE